MVQAGGFATVKEVLSGDVVVVVGQPNNGPPAELRLTLSSLQAPRMAKPNSPDEPFAFESREFLRKLCVGKKVSFKVEYSVQSIGRKFGALYLLQNGIPQENICITIAKAGWARVKDPLSRRQNSQTNGNPPLPPDSECSGDIDEMLAASMLAEQQGLGVFNSNPDVIKRAVRSIRWDVEDMTAFYKTIKGTSQRAIIEYVRDGASMKALLLDSMTYINFNLPGIQCPRESQELTPGEPSYAAEAKFFTEIRLLNREIDLEIGGLGEKYQTIFASVSHPRGNISVELAKNGLALPSDWSMGFTTPSNAAAIHSAVKSAKDKRLRLWKNYKPPTVQGDKNYSGVVAEVVSGDTLVVRVGSPEQLQSAPWECEERKIYLSSIRAPRRGYRDEQPDEEFAHEAKEFLRAKIMGKRCNVSVEYSITPNPDEASKAPVVTRNYGSVMVVLKKKTANAAALILEEGLAHLIGHKANTERSEFYHLLMEAENKAKDIKKGRWGSTSKGGNTVRSSVVDLNTPAMAKSYLPALQQNKGPLIGIVDYIFNGARMKVRIPKHGCVVSFALAGIAAPTVGRARANDAKGGRPGIQTQPFGPESLAFSRASVLQREVELEVETMDRGGTAIGSMFVRNGNKRENLAVILLRIGLAKCVYFSASQSRYRDELFAAEEGAKMARLRIWKDYKEEEVVPDHEAQSSGSLEKVQVTVCHVSNGYTVFLRKKSTAALVASIEKAMAKLAEEFGTSPASEGGLMEPKAGQQCVALFNDGSGAKWYRAKILAVKTEGASQKLHIRYVDFGNEELIEKARARKVSDPSIFAPEELAIEATLAFVDVPALDADYGRDAAIFVSSSCLGKDFDATFHAKNESGKSTVVLYQDKAATTTINGLLLREGLALIPRRVEAWKPQEKELLVKLQEDQEVAHKAHLNMWVYGDPREDDDDRRY